MSPVRTKLDIRKHLSYNNNMAIKEIQETKYGVYVWEMPDGKIVADDDLNWLNIPSVQGDLNKVGKLTDAVRYYGIVEGRAVFLPGRRRVTDKEFEEQKMRVKLGLTPDPFDAAALRDEIKYKKAHGE